MLFRSMKVNIVAVVIRSARPISARLLSQSSRKTTQKTNLKSPRNQETKQELPSNSRVENQQRRNQKIPWIIGGVVVYATGMGVSLFYFGKPDSCEKKEVTEAERRRVYDAGAAAYEQEVCSTEDWTGISDIRRRLIGLAEGRVLEVAAGTGVNLSRNLYAASCRVTCVDCSEGMVGEARVRLAGCGGGAGGVDALVEALAVGDAEQGLQYKDSMFDTVVDAFGLCSFEDPVAALQEMRRVCRPGGKVLLLEHGRSYLPPLNWLLDWSATQHARRWGCYWNRDVEGLVARAGFRVVECRRHHLGTTYAIVASP